MTALAQSSSSQVGPDGEHAGRAGVPRHVAIIMDGNGRWAAARGLPRAEGHRRGVEAVRATIRGAVELGIGYLTLFGFSSENWSRPRDEIDMLFALFRAYVRRDVSRLDAAGIRIKVIGRRDGLPDDIRRMIDEAERKTEKNSGLQVNFAFNYGGRDEIGRAARAIAEDVAAGRLDPASVDEATVASRLDTAGVPDPDLLIRTSGEVRLSNFLLWQCAYAEFVFLPLFWPDFGKADLVEALETYAARSRRYGGVGARETA